VRHPDHGDVFSFAGRSNEVVVAEVMARRLDSPLDSVLKLTDAQGAVLAVNDDHEDLCAGLNTHQADSYFMAKLPADGTYQIHLGDTSRHGGPDYAYRLRLSSPRPDFALRVVPSSLSLRSKSSASLTVYVSRQDGFRGPIKLALKDPPAGFSCSPVTLQSTQTMVKLSIKTDLMATEVPVDLTLVGKATLSGADIERAAIPAEDRMQAFLWRQLVPARDLKVMVFNPSAARPPKRLAPARPSIPLVRAVDESAKSDKPANATNASPNSASPPQGKPAFTAQQIKARLRQLQSLYEDGLLTDDFYEAKVAECGAVP